MKDTQLDHTNRSEGKEKKDNIRIRRIVIALLLILGFCAAEFPGILLFGDKIYPFIFGIPFFYAYLICCWMYICVVLFYAWRTHWGKQRFFNR